MLLNAAFVAALLCLSLYVLQTAAARTSLEVPSNIPTSELDSLHNLYVATNGQHWNWTGKAGVPWVFTSNANPCIEQWQGVTCEGPDFDGIKTVTHLILDDHILNGTLPVSIGDLIGLRELSLSANNITGTLPETLGTLQNLTILSIGDNQIYGTVPANLGNLTNLERFKLNGNNLTGTLPDSLSNMQNLEEMDFFRNHLSGKIPPSYGNLLNLRFIDAEFSQLEGSVPDTFVNLQHLEYFAFDGNQLTGTVPQFICNISSIEYFSLFDNDLRGGLPECFGNLPELKFLFLAKNHLTGTIPASFGTAQKLVALWLQLNQLNGSIPEFVSAHPVLTHLLLYSNHLSGTLSPQLGDAKSLVVLSVWNNSLTGTIPASLGQLSELVHLALDNNNFHGSIPTALSGLSNLTELYLESNDLSGKLVGVFNHTVQTKLSVIQVSDNRLTGTLPESMFLLPKLETLAAVSNCFEGTLPHIMCTNLNVFAYVLDGLQTGKYCRQQLLPGSPSAYVVPNHFGGTVPACLFNMPNLTALHISGNGLTGTLPGDLLVSDRLVDLTISHNALTGTIPRAIQKRVWGTLDLSFNRLTGSLISNFADDLVDLSIHLGHSVVNTSDQNNAVTIALQNNRLSGKVPYTLVNPYNITILGTNLYSCKADKSDLPQKDNQRASYQCGSDSFDAPFYAWMTLLGTTVITIAVVVRYKDKLQRYDVIRVPLECWAKWTSDKVGLPRNFKYVSAMSDILCKLSLWCTVLILVVLVPWYVGASHYYGTYSHMYGWIVSAAFLSGHVPLVVEIIFYPALMVALVAGFASLLVEYDRKEHYQPSRYETRSVDGRYVYMHEQPASLKQRIMIYTAFAVINIVVVVCVNVAYIYVALYRDSTLLLIAQVVIAAFKLFWNSACTPRLIRHIADYISHTSLGTGFVTIQLIMALFNNIVIPCLIVGAVSPSCFYSVFVPPPVIPSKSVFETCLTVRSDGTCKVYVPNVLSTSYSPPFRYDYQCSSSFVTYYAPAFVYLAIAAAFATPVAKLVGHELYKRAIPGSLWFRLLHLMLPRIQKPFGIILDPSSTRNSTSSVSDNMSASVERTPSGRFTGSVSGPEGLSVAGSQNGSLAGSLAGSVNVSLYGSEKSAGGSITAVSIGNSVISYETLKRNVLNPYFDANIFIISLMTYLGILLTFGVVFPPLAVAMSVTMISVAWQGRLAVGRFLYCAREAGALKFVDIIEQECKGAVTIPKMRMCIFIIICFSCSFYALFLYDTLGNAVGQSGAIWTLIVMPLFPLLIYGVILFRRRRRGGLLLDLKMEAAAAMQTEGIPMSSLEDCHHVDGSGVSSDNRQSGDANAADRGDTTFNILRV